MKEKMDFFDACRIAAGTNRRIRHHNGEWMRLVSSNCVSVLRDGDSINDWWPDPQQQREKAWSVEPEKPEEALFWCVCDEDGSSWIYEGKPVLSRQGLWKTQENQTLTKLLSRDNLFPKDEPKQYRLVPVNQPLIPWKKFDPKTMPRKNAEIIVVVKSGNIYVDTWLFVGDKGALRDYSVTHVTHYCLRSEFPFPEEDVK